MPTEKRDDCQVSQVDLCQEQNRQEGLQKMACEEPPSALEDILVEADYNVEFVVVYDKREPPDKRTIRKNRCVT